jgi:hypothetical protein
MAKSKSKQADKAAASKDDKVSTETDNEVQTNEDEEDEVWDVVEVLSSDKKGPRCRMKPCKKYAVAIWASNQNVKDTWPMCEKCQETEFGGWPEGMDPDGSGGEELEEAVESGNDGVDSTKDAVEEDEDKITSEDTKVGKEDEKKDALDGDDEGAARISEDEDASGGLIENDKADGTTEGATESVVVEPGVSEQEDQDATMSGADVSIQGESNQATEKPVPDSIEDSTETKMTDTSNKQSSSASVVTDDSVDGNDSNDDGAEISDSGAQSDEEQTEESMDSTADKNDGEDSREGGEQEKGEQDSKEQDDDEEGEDDEDDEESWDLVKVMMPDELVSPIKCSTEDCALAAACVYKSSVKGTLWYSCLDCQVR